MMTQTARAVSREHGSLAKLQPLIAAKKSPRQMAAIALPEARVFITVHFFLITHM